MEQAPPSSPRHQAGDTWAHGHYLSPALTLGPKPSMSLPCLLDKQYPLRLARPDEFLNYMMCWESFVTNVNWSAEIIPVMFLSCTCISICFISVREKDQITANVPSTGHNPKPGLLCVMACSLSCHIANVVPPGLWKEKWWGLLLQILVSKPTLVHAWLLRFIITLS